uniref:ubiquitinyl hydrolase 1 n=1 Tax=Aceria tosichella TaxID=561515 RepID=A0A6G1S8N0_9ACAR
MDSDNDLRGLIGLQNLGNTCYINAALQALSNCQQLTRFVLDCPEVIKDSGLSLCYSELIKEIWNPNSQYAVPTSIVRNIKCIYPAFRGCTQQDAQEFLRCFLEQLHDELKEPVINNNIKKKKNNNNKTLVKPQTKQSPLASSSSSLSSTEPTPEESGDCSVDTNHMGTKNDGDEDDTDDKSNENSCDSQQLLLKQQQQNQRQEEEVEQQHQQQPQPPQQQRSIISDTFEFRISSSIVCSSCNNISTTKETFKDLSVSIPSRDHPIYQQRQNVVQQIADSDEGSYLDSIPLARWFLDWFSQLGSWFWGPQVTLQDCLSVFFGTDPLEGENEYSCEICTKKNRGVKYLKILELPEVLCIHFKRYESVGSAKITTHVQFPLTGLDLAPYMCPSSEADCTTYNLIACICHHGSALLTGHYTTYALNCYDDQWYEFDDQYVTCVSDYQVENSEAYILFYQKTTSRLGGAHAYFHNEVSESNDGDSNNDDGDDDDEDDDEELSR